MYDRLRILFLEKKKKWFEYFLYLVYIYNVIVYLLIGYFLYFLFFGWEFIFFIDLMFGLYKFLDDDSENLFMDDWI